MTTYESKRICVMLPHRTSGQIEAAKECLRWLEVHFPNGTVLGVETPAEPAEERQSLASLSELSLRATSHGAWLNPGTGTVEHDSHIAFVVHVPRSPTSDECEAPRLRAENIEEVMYMFYFWQARQGGEQSTYQKLLFVESWDAEYVHRPGRHDLTAQVARRQEP